MKYLSLFGCSAAIFISILLGGCFLAESAFTIGHWFLAIGGAAMITLLGWLMKNPPNQDNEDRVTMLWRD